MRVTDTGGAGATIPTTGTGAAPAGRTMRSRPCLGSSISRTVGAIVNNFILLTKYPFLYSMFYGCIINPVLHVTYTHIVCILCTCIYADLLFNFYSVTFLKHYFITIYNFVE